jgi:FMN phosphatase YigB (HAD superfamily)
MDNSAERKKTLVLWDVGAVLVRLTYGKFYENGARLHNEQNPDLDIAPDQFRRLFVESRLEERQVRGEISTNHFLDGIAKLVSPYTSKNEALSLVMNCWGAPLQPMIDLKRRIYEAGYSVGIISNISELAWIALTAKSPEMFSVYDSSSPVLFSYREGTIKPKRDFYERVNGYSQVIFIDDKTEYLRYPCEKIGWKGIWYNGCIDEAETMRLIQPKGAMQVDGKNILAAESAMQLAMALERFGLRL